MITYEMNNGSVTKEQAQYWWEKVEGYPIIYGKATAWEGILGGNNASWILLIMLVVCIGAAPVFAGNISLVQIRFFCVCDMENQN